MKCPDCLHATNKEVMFDSDKLVFGEDSVGSNFPRCTNEKSKQFGLIVYQWTGCEAFACKECLQTKIIE